MTNPGPRVLVVSPPLEIGGTEMHLARVLPELKRRGVDVSMFVLSRGGKLEPRLVAGGIAVNGPNKSVPRLLRRVYAAIQLRRVLSRLRPDIIHFFLAEPYLVGSLASAGMRHPIRAMSRRSLAIYQRRYPVLGQIERWLHRFTDVLLGNSTAVIDELAAECGEPGKVKLIYNGVDIPEAASLEQRSALRRELGIPLDAFVLVVSANFIAYKGHVDLFDALAGLSGHFAGRWRLLLIGHDQGAGAALRRKAVDLSFAENVIWVEDRADAQSLLAAADIAVVPSHQEGFSNSLLEAMACGLAVVATRVGGNIDAVIDGESGLLVPLKDPTALMAAIFRLDDDKALRQRLGAAARSRVNAKFSLGVCVQNYFDLYTRLTNAQRGAQSMRLDAGQAEP